MSYERASDIFEPAVDYAVTFVSEIGRVEVADANGQPVGEPGELAPATASDAAEQLTSIDMAFGGAGEQVHLAAADVLAHPEIDAHPESLAIACNALAKVLPREIFNYIGTKETPIALSLGSFSVAARRATSEELPPGGPSSPPELDRQDTEKIDLTSYDHAMVTVEGKRYAIAFDTPEARLLARTIDAIREMRAASKDPYITLRTLPRLVWSAIPLSERAIYAKTEKQIHATSSVPIRDRVDTLLNKATNVMGITRRSRTASVYYVRAKDISVEYSTSPQEDDNNATQVVAFDTPQDIARRMHEQQVSAEDLAFADTALGYIKEGEWFRLSHQLAVDLVEFIMTRKGKVALRSAIARTGKGQDYAEAYNRLHTIAHRSLGASYYPTRGALVISGGRWAQGQRVRQTGGSLRPSTTRADLAFSKWTLLHPPAAPNTPEASD